MELTKIKLTYQIDRLTYKFPLSKIEDFIPDIVGYATSEEHFLMHLYILTV